MIVFSAVDKLTVLITLRIVVTYQNILSKYTKESKMAKNRKKKKNKIQVLSSVNNNLHLYFLNI